MIARIYRQKINIEEISLELNEFSVKIYDVFNLIENDNTKTVVIMENCEDIRNFLKKNKEKF